MRGHKATGRKKGASRDRREQRRDVAQAKERKNTAGWVCANCRQRRGDHLDNDRCLFSPTKFKPVDIYDRNFFPV